MNKTADKLTDFMVNDAFARRHIGPDQPDVDAMLEQVGATSLNDLIEKAMPHTIRCERPLDLPPAMAEHEALNTLRAMADANTSMTSMIGMGYYGTITPGVILRNVLENPGWYTA